MYYRYNSEDYIEKINTDAGDDYDDYYEDEYEELFNNMLYYRNQIPYIPYMNYQMMYFYPMMWNMLMYENQMRALREDNFSFRQDKLGTKWIEQEKLWKGVWVRRGTSNAFDATYTHPHDNPIYATVYITITGNHVTVQRRNASEGGDCDYVGVLSPDGKTVTGSYKCDSGGGSTWSATIINDIGSGHGSKPEPSTTPVSFDYDFFNGIGKVRGTVYPGQNKVQIETFIFGVRVANETYRLEDRELVWEKSQGGQKVKVVVGLKPSGKTLYIRGELKIGGRIVGKFGPTTLASW